LQTAFLSIRGHALGSCPITNLFEVLVFLAWSIALIYMLIGTAYRLSLMGAFTAPLVFLLQVTALVLPIDTARASRVSPNPWLEFHASISIIAYGAFALACVAGAMYLVQERQLKTHQLRSITAAILTAGRNSSFSSKSWRGWPLNPESKESGTASTHR
jgi:ABC-type transport system involved in cytochrome c biogenesis permease subunit